jgi:lipopolysaccharide export system protein LptC
MSISPTAPSRWTGGAAGPLASANGEARSARAFAAARRHSLFVRVLRIALIVGVIGGIATLTLLALYRTFGVALGRLSIGEVSIDGSTITMDKPRLTGARRDGDGYVINAAKAIQDLRHPTQVELVAIEGDIGAADHDTLHLSASSGHYDTERESLDLSGVVRLKNSRYTVELRSAHIDFKSGAYTSSEPLTVLIDAGTSITADSGAVRDNAQEVTFEGHVKTLIQPKNGDADAGKTIKGTVP